MRVRPSTFPRLILLAAALTLRADVARTAEDAAASARAAVRRALDARAGWTMERRLPGAPFPLRSSGTVTCRSGSGIVWRVSAPFVSSVAMTRETMVFRDDDGTRVKRLSELPHYAEIRDRADAFAAGDDRLFDGLFDIRVTGREDGGWLLTLVPLPAPMKKLFVSATVSGRDLPETVTFATADGGTTLIRFKDLR